MITKGYNTDSIRSVFRRAFRFIEKTLYVFFLSALIAFIGFMYGAGSLSQGGISKKDISFPCTVKGKKETCWVTRYTLNCHYKRPLRETASRRYWIGQWKPDNEHARKIDMKEYEKFYVWPEHKRNGIVSPAWLKTKQRSEKDYCPSIMDLDSLLLEYKEWKT